MMPTEMSDQLLQRLKAHRTETAIVPAPTLRRVYHVPMHRTQMLQQVRLLLEHGHTQSTGKRLLAGVHPQMRLQVPRHAKLFAAVLAPVLAQVRHIATGRTAAALTTRHARRCGSSGAGCPTHQTVLQAHRSVLALDEVCIGRQCTQDGSSARQSEAMVLPWVDKGGRIGQGR